MKTLVNQFQAAVIGLLVITLLFVTFEPSISIGATTDSKQFTISQTVSSEVAFTSNPSNVTMSPTLPGITGGLAKGETQFAITSNSLTGYRVTVTASSSSGVMTGTASTSNVIPAYVPSTPGLPDYTWSVAANKAGFGYSVTASTTSDVALPFKYTGTACGGAATDQAAKGHCWINATSTAYTIINRPLPTTGGAATSTILFQVEIMANPSPMIPNDTYIATTTLTATVQ